MNRKKRRRVYGVWSNEVFGGVRGGEERLGGGGAGDISSVVERERLAVGEEGERDTKKTREVGER